MGIMSKRIAKFFTSPTDTVLCTLGEWYVKVMTTPQDTPATIGYRLVMGTVNRVKSSVELPTKVATWLILWSWQQADKKWAKQYKKNQRS